MFFSLLHSKWFCSLSLPYTIILIKNRKQPLKPNNNNEQNENQMDRKTLKLWIHSIRTKVEAYNMLCCYYLTKKLFFSAMNYWTNTRSLFENYIFLVEKNPFVLRELWPTKVFFIVALVIQKPIYSNTMYTNISLIRKSH